MDMRSVGAEMSAYFFIMLKIARSRLFKSARAAAASLDLPPATYGAHERAQLQGGRDYGPEDAIRYGQHFGVSAEWLLTGADIGPASLGEPAAIFADLGGEFGRENLSDLRLLAVALALLSAQTKQDIDLLDDAISRLGKAEPYQHDKATKSRIIRTVQRLTGSLEAARGLTNSLVAELREEIDGIRPHNVGEASSSALDVRAGRRRRQNVDKRKS
jgi:hypothetical protein